VALKAAKWELGGLPKKNWLREIDAFYLLDFCRQMKLTQISDSEVARRLPEVEAAAQSNVSPSRNRIPVLVGILGWRGMLHRTDNKPNYLYNASCSPTRIPDLLGINNIFVWVQYTCSK
jgi:hypothetical protein